MTLVELLVAMTIGLAVTLVVTTLLVVSENHKRTTTSTNDAEQTGNYAFYALDRALRDAGSGIAQSGLSGNDTGVLGCELNVAGFLPRSSPFPTPFAGFLPTAPASLRVAPVLIAQAQSDGGSDVLVVMGGSGAAGGVSRPITGVGDVSSLVLENTVGFVGADDLALVSQPGTTDCLLEQVASASGSTLTLKTNGVYYTKNGTATGLATLAASLSAYVTPLGNAQANNVQYQLFGVGTDNVLYSYDLLQNQLKVQSSGNDTSQPLADQVVSLNAIYGVQTTTTPGVLDHWVAPNAAAGYDIATVMGSEAKMESIIAVHVALLVRGEYYDKNVNNVEGLPTQVTLFNGYTDGSGNSLATTVSLKNPTTNVPNYRYRLFEFTVPLRNMIILAKS
jgi:type IV pilus assembly protein PilW